jgi:hypothetical protein
LTASEDRRSPRPVVVLLQPGVTPEEARSTRAKAWEYVHACYEANRATRRSQERKKPGQERREEKPG